MSRNRPGHAAPKGKPAMAGGGRRPKGDRGLVAAGLAVGLTLMAFGALATLGGALLLRLLFGIRIMTAVSQAAAATDPNDKLAADRKLGEQTSILVNAIHENYPQLESNKNVKTLMTQLEGSENRISVERKRYIDQVNAYNRQVTSFPANLVAGMFGFQKLQQYEAPAGSDEVPEVNLE